MTNLSEAAKTTLINALGGKTFLPEGPLLRQLKFEGLVGPRGGLTRAGEIMAMKLKREAEEKAFS